MYLRESGSEVEEIISALRQREGSGISDVEISGSATRQL